MKYYVIDCNYLCYKAHYTMGQLQYQGQSTGVIFGFLQQILNMAETFETNKFIFIWDSKESRRKEIYPGYKKGRHEDLTPKEREELYACYDQMNLFYDEILVEIGFTNNFKQEGYEGDDLMARLVRQEEYADDDFTLCASDHDLYYLLAHNVRMMTVERDQFIFYTLKKYREEWGGITPEDWLMVKQIAGCHSDKVPGCGRDINNPENIIARIAEKTAADYILKNLKPTTKAYKRIDSAEGREIIERNEKLIKIPFPGTLPLTIVKNNFSRRGMKQIFRRYGLNEFLVDRADEWDRLLTGDYSL